MKIDHSTIVLKFPTSVMALGIASLFFTACQEDATESPTSAPPEAGEEAAAPEEKKEQKAVVAPKEEPKKKEKAPAATKVDDSKEKSSSPVAVNKEEKEVAAPQEEPKKKEEAKAKMARAYFASGCFWCVEAVYESVRGVKESISGYSGGHTENPTYESSNTGTTGHAEAVEIIYDPAVVDFATLVDVYFGSQNISQKNGQGPDHGSQYRSILFYRDAEQKKIIEDKIAKLEEELGEGQVAAEVMEFEKFWVGEDYHQDYEKLNPNHYYIRNVSIPRLKKFQAKFPHLLKDDSHGE